SVAEYVRQGGSVLAADGTRRELCGPVAYQLEMRPAAEPTDGAVCPWCSSPLWTVLDLDTGQPEVGQALAHTGWSGRRRVTTRVPCVNYTPLYTEVSPDGGARWSAHNQRPEYLRVGPPEPPPALLPVVGARHATAHLASAWDEGGTTLGGAPDWIQD